MSFFLLFIVAGIVAGLSARGSLLRLLDLQLRHWWLLVIGILLRFPLMFSESFSQATAGWLGVSLQIGGLIVVLSFAIINRHIRGVFWIGLGTLLTLIAVVVNGGYMPGSDGLYLALLKYYGLEAEAQALQAGGPIMYHTVSLTGETRLWFLTDIIPIPRIIQHPYLVSIGDVFIGTGIFLVIFWGMRGVTVKATEEAAKSLCR